LYYQFDNSIDNNFKERVSMGKRVLIVDDAAFMRMMIKDI